MDFIGYRGNRFHRPRACLKKAFCKMCVTICGNNFPNTLWRLIGRIKKWQLTPWNYLNLRTCGTLLQGVTRNSHNLFPPYSRPAFPKEPWSKFRSPYQMAELSLPTWKYSRKTLKLWKVYRITSKYLAKFYLDFTMFLHKKIVFLSKKQQKLYTNVENFST